MILEKNTFEELTLPNFKTYYKATLIVIVWYRGKNRYIDQWNRMGGCPEIDSQKYSQLIWQNKWFWNNWASILKKWNVDADSFHSVNSKQITDLNVKCKTLKLLEDYNRGENLDNFWYGDFFLHSRPKTNPWKK